MTLLRAIAVAHRYSQRAQGGSLAVSVLVAALGLMTRPAPGTTSTVVLVGTGWAVIYATLVVPWSARHMRTSAMLQEMLDVGLFNLPWNGVLVGDRVSEDDVSRLSRRFRGDLNRLRDYYLVANVPAPYDVLFCLKQNLAWGSRVRRRFANALVVVVVLWLATGFIVGIATGGTISQFVTQWFVPSLGLLLLCLDIYRAQVSITRERTRVVVLLRPVVDDPASPVLASDLTFTAFARRIQDVLFQLRRQQPRTPDWFFRLFHDRDKEDFQFEMQHLEARLGDATTQSPP
jgi:hypothetical protein